LVLVSSLPERLCAQHKQRYRHKSLKDMKDLPDDVIHVIYDQEPDEDRSGFYALK